MQTFTIIADSSENPHTKPWWKFWEKLPLEDVAQNEYWTINIKYMKNSPGHSVLNTESHLTKTAIFLSDKLCQEQEENIELNRTISLKIFPQIVKSKGFSDSRNCRIAFYDEEIDLIYLIELAKLCKEIIVISDNFNNIFADKVFAETGLIIEQQKALHEAEHDFIFKNSGEIFDFIDNKKYEVYIKYDLLPPLPVKSNNLRLAKWLLNKEFITLDECKISYHKS